MNAVIAGLLASEEPCVQYKVRAGVLGESPSARGMASLRQAVRDGPRVRTMLSEVGEGGLIPTHPYNKWRGAHWLLAQLCDLGYPPGDKSLKPLANQAVTWSLGCEARVVNGRPRRCASQQGYPLLYMLRLGLEDERCDELARRLMEWQWPDGGWNCDKRPAAHCSSVHESLLPLRGLAAYAKWAKDRKAAAAADRAAEFFLERRLMWRKSTGKPIRPSFLLLSYPLFYHYGLLHALRAMADAGRIGDPRCRDALDVLESKRLPDGTFAMEAQRYDRHTKIENSGTGRASLVKWSRGGKTTGNEFVTAEALTILKAAGRLEA